MQLISVEETVSFTLKKILYIVRERGSKLWNLPHLPTSTLSIELMTYFTIY